MEMRLLLVSASLVVMASAAIYVCRTYPLKVGVPSGETNARIDLLFNIVP